MRKTTFQILNGILQQPNSITDWLHALRLLIARKLYITLDFCCRQSKVNLARHHREGQKQTQLRHFTIGQAVQTRNYQRSRFGSKNWVQGYINDHILMSFGVGQYLETPRLSNLGSSEICPI